MSSVRERALLGEAIGVEPHRIEGQLAEFWRLDPSGEQGVLRAALWNVIAHTASPELQMKANETLARVATKLPQRSIVVRADRGGEPALSSFVSANCHLIAPGRQVCSENIAIVAGGSQISRVPPLVSSLLIPDMPVAVWWIGDLPNEHEDYVCALLAPADRLIVDSIHFDRPADLALIGRVAAKTTTSPADINWVRLEEWRAATASIFDPPHMRARLSQIRAVRVMASVDDPKYFGSQIEALFYSSWLTTQAGQVVAEDGKVEGTRGAVEYTFRYDTVDVIRGILQVEIEFGDGSIARISCDPKRGILLANVDGVTQAPESVTRSKAKGSDDLIVRQLKRPESDRVFLRVLPVSVRLARRIVG
ncbi:MAG: glucose-6-phosphate dehydrogenase assembly protein OpcA [Thermoanaerobaculia bacterium]